MGGPKILPLCCLDWGTHNGVGVCTKHLIFETSNWIPLANCCAHKPQGLFLTVDLAQQKLLYPIGVMHQLSFSLATKKNALLERKGRKHGSTISNSAARTTVTANSPCANAGRLVKCPGCSGWTKLVHTLENHAIDHILWNEGAVLRIVVSNRTESWTDCIIVKNRPSLLYCSVL